MKNQAVLSGLSFGMTSAAITTLGLLVGLESSTGSTSVVLAGILTIAIADAFSDALGMHVAKQSEDIGDIRDIWLATVATFLTKFIFALTFAIPFFFLAIKIAVLVTVLWGFLIVIVLSYRIAISQASRPWVRVVAENLAIAAIVVIITQLFGKVIHVWFPS